MGFVNDELSTISFREGHEASYGYAVAIHAENALAYNEFLPNSGKTRAGVISSQFSLERMHIQRRKDYFARARETQAVNDAGVIRGIGKNDVAWLKERTQQTDVRRIARIEIESGFRTHEVRDFGFELLPNISIARKKPRAGGSDGT